MRAIDKFERLGQKIYNGQDVLKNSYLKSYPIHLTDDPSDYSVVTKYADRGDFVWLVNKNIKILKTFPWHFKPTEKDCVHLFPYVHKRSKKPISWNHVRLVPTKLGVEKFKQHRHICGEYDVYCDKENFDIFFYGNKETGTWEQIIEYYPQAQHVVSFKEAQEKSTTDMFWYVPDDVIILDEKFFKYEPDDWSLDYIHVFANGRIDQFDGIVLFPKNAEPSEKELKHRYYANKKEVKKVNTKPRTYNVYYIDTYDEYLEALNDSPYEMFWGVSNNVQIDVDFDFSTYFSHHNSFDRNINHAFVHRIDYKNYYNGVFLFSKNSLLTKNEIEHRNPINRKEWNNVASGPIEYNKFYIETYEEYLYALENSKTEMFWALTNNVQIDPKFDFSFYLSHDSYDKKENHAFIHRVGEEDYYNGIFLLSKHKSITQKEIENRFIIERKEWNIVASRPVQYDKFFIKTYEDYQRALKDSKTEMFWGIDPRVKIDKNFKFDIYFTHDNEYDRKQNHVFLHKQGNKTFKDSVFLFSKHKPVTENEINHQFLVDKKEWPRVASVYKPYDQFYVDTWEEYQYALENTTTEMFWALSRNVKIDPNFKLDIFFEYRTNEFDYEQKENHAFIHRVGEEDLYNGIFLMSIHKPVTQKEIENRHLVNRKNWHMVASGPVQYDRFTVDTYDDYLYAVKNSKTEMFWAVSSNVNTSGFNFDVYFTHNNTYDRTTNHAFAHEVDGEKYYNGIFLLPKVNLSDEVDDLEDSL